MGPSSGVAPTRLLSTVTSINVMLPAFRTVPLNSITSPGRTGVLGHSLVTRIWGVPVTVQVAVKESVTAGPGQSGWPVTRTVLKTSQQFSGT